MITRDYTINNAELASVVLDEPVTFVPGTTPKYWVKILLSDEDAKTISYLVKEVAETAFGEGTKNVLGFNQGRSRVRYGAEGIYELYASSSSKPKITGAPSSKGNRLAFIKRADVCIQVYSQATQFFKGVGVELKELIF